MIRKVETFRSDVSDIRREDILNLIDYCKHVTTIFNDIAYKIVIDLEFPIPYKYYDGSKIITINSIQKVEITKDSTVEEIMKTIDKYKIKTFKQFAESEKLYKEELNC